MAAFSYQYHPFLVDSAFMLNINTGPPPSQFHLHQETSFNMDTNCVDETSKITTNDNNEPFVVKNLSPQSSMVLDKLQIGDEQTTHIVTTMDKKKRTRNNGPSSSNPQSKVMLSFFLTLRYITVRKN